MGKLAWFGLPGLAALLWSSLLFADAAERSITFEQIRGGEPVRLEGLDNAARLNFGIPLEEAVTAAELDLSMAVSPALLTRLSHLNLRLNGRFVATVAVNAEEAGGRIRQTVTVDPRLFADYNQLEMELVGHYTESCSDPAHSSLWAQISPESTLRLETEPLNIRTGLSAFPVPFFDARDNRQLTLPVAFAVEPEPHQLATAGMLTSWFGEMAGYRGADFPVSIGELPDRHALVLVDNGALPEGWGLEPVDEPTISVLASSSDSRIKRLVIQGRDAAQLRTAALGMIHGRALLSGHRATIEAFTPPPPRRVNEVPAWVATDRPVQLGELVDSVEALQVAGYHPAPITLNARIPPDLFTGFYEGVDLDLRYRYTRPSSMDGSRLSVFVNDRFVQSLGLRPEDNGERVSRIQLPLLERQRAQARDELRLPAFQLGIENRLRFAFSHRPPQSDACAATPGDDVYAAIDPNSSIDLSDFPRFARMPDLALFANAGYPFSRYADLSQTTIVLPDDYSVTEMEATLNLLGRLGRLTGVAATHFGITRHSELDAPDSDLLMIGASPDWLAPVGQGASAAESGAPLLLDAARRQLRRASGGAPHIDATIRTGGDVGALVGFESPYRAGRSVVAVSGNSAEGLRQVASALGDPGRINRIRYGATLIVGDEVRPIETAQTYSIGNLSWWQRLWHYFGLHPLLLTALSIVAALLMALLAFWLLRGVAAARSRN